MPGDIVYNVGLRQEVTTWQQVFGDEVLVGPHRNTITHTKRAQDIQNLKAEVLTFECGRAENTLLASISRLIKKGTFWGANTVSGCYIF